MLLLQTSQGAPCPRIFWVPLREKHSDFVKLNPRASEGSGFLGEDRELLCEGGAFCLVGMCCCCSPFVPGDRMKVTPVRGKEVRERRGLHKKFRNLFIIILQAEKAGSSQLTAWNKHQAGSCPLLSFPSVGSPWRLLGFTVGRSARTVKKIQK